MSKQTTIAAIASVAATFALVALTPPSFAATPETRNTTEVRYADLDLSSDEGRAELSQRIDKAAREVCGMDDIQTGTRIPYRSKVECYANAKRQIEPQFARLIDSSNRGA